MRVLIFLFLPIAVFSQNIVSDSFWLSDIGSAGTVDPASGLFKVFVTKF